MNQFSLNKYNMHKWQDKYLLNDQDTEICHLYIIAFREKFKKKY